MNTGQFSCKMEEPVEINDVLRAVMCKLENKILFLEQMIYKAKGRCLIGNEMEN